MRTKIVQKHAPDKVLVDIADYVSDYKITRAGAYRTARYCVIDALGCAVNALNYPECNKLLGPLVPGIVCPHGARVPGTQFELDPVSAAFNIGCMIRWLELNDAFTGGGHPSDNLGGILATADYLSRRQIAECRPPLVMRDVLTAMIKAYEIQGVLSLENSFARLGLGFDHSALERVASTAVVTKMLGGSREEIINAVSNAWADGLPLKIYRQAPNTGTRKSWAGGDATSRAVNLALMALKGEMGYPTVLTAKTFGFYDAYFSGQPFKFQRGYGSFVLENVIFKSVATGLHSQTAVECAFKLHPQVKDRLDRIKSVTITTQAALIGIMDKRGPLHNTADRDHCAQYVVAVGMIYGRLSPSDFEDEFATDPRIDLLRSKMVVVEDPRYTRDAHDPAKRSSANAIQVCFKDGSSTPRVEIEYPIGHRQRHLERTSMLDAKFSANLARRFPPRQQDAILELCLDQSRFEATPVNEFVDRFII